MTLVKCFSLYLEGVGPQEMITTQSKKVPNGVMRVLKICALGTQGGRNMLFLEVLVDAFTWAGHAGRRTMLSKRRG